MAVLPRPRILLADDHAPVLESVRRCLDAAFDIVATATDGRQAVDLAMRLRPEVAVLDVAMPDCDGFETLKQVRQGGLETKVVFLTMHSDDEFVAAAIDAGAHGYVLKSRLHSDLISAIDHTLAGRLFLPSLTSLSNVAGSRHTVQFHANVTDYVEEVSRLADATLRSGEPFILIGSEALRNSVAERLNARHLNVERLAEQERYVTQDTELAVSNVLRGRSVDKESVGKMIGGLQRLLAVPNRTPGRLTIVGDMSASLCRNGNFSAALELEQTWDELTHALPFFTVCSYPNECFVRPESRNVLPTVCAAHSAVVHVRNLA